MLKSMTGFGVTMASLGDTTLQVEVKSLNSKFFDLNFRLPKMFAEKEVELRNVISDKLERGKISVTIDMLKGPLEEMRPQYNEALFIAHYTELKKLADRVLAPYDMLFDLALRSPGVAESQEKEILDPVTYKKLLDLLGGAIEACDAFRKQEGETLSVKMLGYLASINNQLHEVERLDPLRIEKIRARIRRGITEFFGEEGFDANRLEQEIIFYIEKLDIHEERVRLASHLDYFTSVVKESQSNGKKLSFIAQEMGREINTIGSKANDAPIQKAVVVMKEELEKIKEQLNNVL